MIFLMSFTKHALNGVAMKKRIPDIFFMLAKTGAKL